MAQQQTVTFGRRGLAAARPAMTLPGAAPAAAVGDGLTLPGAVSLDYLLGHAESVPESAADETDMMRFIGANWPKYRELWRSMRLGGELRVSFSFAAFFFATLWLLYRKLYAYAFASFGLAFIAGFVAPKQGWIISLAIHIACGLFGKSLVVQRAMETIRNIRAMGMGGEGTTLRIERAGGTNWIAPAALGSLLFLFFFLVFSVGVAIGMKQAVEKGQMQRTGAGVTRKI